MEVLGGLLGTFACIPDRQDKTRHDGDMLNYRKLAFANELQFEMGNCFLDRLAYNQAIECILKTNMYEFPKSKKINDQYFGNPNISGMLPLEKAIEIRPSIPKSRVKPKKRILGLHDNRKPTKNANSYLICSENPFLAYQFGKSNVRQLVK